MCMIKNIIDKISEIEKPVIAIMKKGFKFSYIVCIIAIATLCTYLFLDKSPNLYYIGITLFKTGLMFIAEFVICGMAMDKIKKQLN